MSAHTETRSEEGHGGVGPALASLARNLPLWRVLFFLSGLGLAGAVMAYDWAADGRLPWAKWPVDLSMEAVWRSVPLAAAGLLLVLALRAPRAVRRDAPVAFSPAFRLMSEITAAFMMAAAALVLVSPYVLHGLRVEDGVLESLSAVLMLGAALVIWGAVKYVPRRLALGFANLPVRPLLLGAGGVFALIFLEEISWGQRLFGFATTETFSGNDQGETNLHNFATLQAEQLYYLGAVGAFVILPYAMVAPRARLSHPVLALLPLPAFAVAAAPVAFLQAEMWNSVPMQVAAWFALFALIDLAGMARPRSRLWIVLILLACAFAQTVFLVEAAVLKRANDLTEYKETVIAFLCLAYTVSVLIRARAAAQAASSPGMKSASPNTAIRTSIP